MNKEVIVKVIKSCVKVCIVYYVIVAVADTYNDNSESMIIKASSLAKGKEIGDIVDIRILRSFLWKTYLWKVKQYAIVDIVNGKYVVKYCGSRPGTKEERDEVFKQHSKKD